MPLPLTRPARSRELVCFLVVGGLGYIVDVVAFNLLLSHRPFSGWDPTVARTVAMAAAMVVTFSGNRWWTWQGVRRHDRRREAALFVLFNLVGLAISVAALVVSHDLLGLTSRLDDNLSANVVGLGLATAFRFWSYRTFVFGTSDAGGGAHSSSESRRTTTESAANPTAFSPHPTRSSA